LIRETRFVQRSEEPIATSVSGEDASSSIATVGGGRKPQHQQSCPRIAKARNRFAPVLLIAKSSNLLASDRLAPLDQPRAETASDDPVLQ
jgi:hypothetical protein